MLENIFETFYVAGGNFSGRKFREEFFCGGIFLICDFSGRELFGDEISLGENFSDKNL